MLIGRISRGQSLIGFINGVRHLESSPKEQITQMLLNSVILQFLWSNPFALAVSTLLVVAGSVWIALSFARDRGKHEAREGVQ